MKYMGDSGILLGLRFNDLCWVWKNPDADAVGLVHYRRFCWAAFFKADRGRDGFQNALDKAPVILPRKRHCWIETNYSQYIHAHHLQDLEITHAVLAELCQNCLPACDSVMRKRSGHRFNMFVMRRDYLDVWCAWLFHVLFGVEARPGHRQLRRL